MSDEQKLETELQSKGLNAPRLTPQNIDSVILSEHYFNAEQGVRSAYRDNNDVHLGSTINAKAAEGLPSITFCVLILNNGFKIVGVNCASVSPENFDEQLGRKLAYEDARRKIWELEGYLLKERLYQSELDKQF
ncbi:Gp49 family protein [Acinetobacter lactucae]|uniref:Phage family protein n=1 Tax=Acinetobacter lactucae TaxID=1785128 RepID=R8YVS2_9GAMM|nr:Gp49 family protein [Acinetobacter lactucae]EOQ73495.1 hypothetical protein F929_03438 [Acinetobacter lactucae]